MALNAKLTLFLIERVYETKKRISIVNRHISPPSHSSLIFNMWPKIAVNMSRRAGARRERVSIRTSASVNFIQHDLGPVHLPTRSHWMKYKFDLAYCLNKKNLPYISWRSREAKSDLLMTRDITHATLYVTPKFWYWAPNYATGRHRQYRNLVLSTIVKHIPNLVNAEVDKRASATFFSLSRRKDSYPPLQCDTVADKVAHRQALAHFQLHAEFLHSISYPDSLPSDLLYFPSSSYFCLASPNLAVENKSNAAPSSRSSLSQGGKTYGSQLARNIKGVNIHLDLQLPKLRKPLYAEQNPQRASDLSSSSPRRPLAPSIFLFFKSSLRPLIFASRRSSPRSSPIHRSPTSEQFPLFDPHIHHNLRACWPSLALSVRYHSSKSYNASAFVHNPSRFAIASSKKSNRGKNKLQQPKNAALSILKLLSPHRIGAGFQSSGRIYGAKKASSFKILLGSVPLNTLDAFIDYSGITQKTRNGTWGFKVRLCRDPSVAGFFDPSLISPSRPLGVNGTSSK